MTPVIALCWLGDKLILPGDYCQKKLTNAYNIAYIDGLNARRIDTHFSIAKPLSRCLVFVWHWKTRIKQIFLFRNLHFWPIIRLLCWIMSNTPHKERTEPAIVKATMGFLCYFPNGCRWILPWEIGIVIPTVNKTRLGFTLYVLNFS